VIDVETRARRAGGAARTEATARAALLEVPGVAPDPGGRRFGWPVVGVVTGTVALLLVVLLVGQFAPPPAPVIEPAVPDVADLVPDPVAVDGVLPVPPVGEAIPAYLEDGTPVFVSHPADGEVYVLEAFDGHGVGGIHEMVHWCSSSQQFEEARHSTRFNAYGDYTGGPAPRPLLDVQAELLGDGRVQVTGPPGPARGRTDVRAEVPTAGPSCLAGARETELAEDAVAHRRPTELPQLDGSALPQGRWVWAQVRLGGPEGDPRVCELDGRCPSSAPRITAGSQAPAVSSADLVTLLVRGAGLSAELALGPDPAWSQLPLVGPGFVPATLPIPAPGGAGFEQLQDGTPVVVTQTQDGGLHVLDATVPGRPDLLGSCGADGRLTHGADATWTLDGAGSASAPADLGTYPFEVLTSGEARALRVTGPVGPPAARSGGGFADRVGPCAGEVDGHRPPAGWPVATRLSPSTTGPEARSWSWVEARLAEADGALVLCAYLGPDACGDPVPTDDTNADCYGDLPTGGACADRDPTVVTPGLSPTDEPVLLLVRLAGDGATAEVRRPAGS
jgi:hypothetical protein